MKWYFDYAWRLPIAIFIRAPILVAGYGVEILANILINIGSDIPGLPTRR